MNTQIKLGVIPAAGMGTRFGYLSRMLPKALLPLYDRPVLHHVIDHMLDVGIEDIYIIVHAGKSAIRNYLRHITKPKTSRLHFIHQIKLDGLGSAILLAEKHVKDEPFMVILGDDCTISDSFKSMIQEFLSSTVVASEGVVIEKNTKILQQTNSVDLGRDKRITDIIEKPRTPKYLYRGCGIYLFRPQIFDYIRKTPISTLRNEREITHTLQMLAKKRQVSGHLIKGRNININNYDDLYAASGLIKQSMKSLDK